MTTGLASNLFISAARKPFVATIDGVPLAGGLEVAMACHARITTSTVQLGLHELQLGIIPRFGSVGPVYHYSEIIVEMIYYS
ncbi:hypothetical protein L1987_30851 [Smallanthus sonchifolius]|uniref:Uncharacterized protein n=1 Tax=Smallanthus sonchifolius TaxID=185202 RepID=A0ACB9I407_9ASTR|nr:hypothetical protein L1987_30851 [Smallanthus sonchifolius]